LPRYSSPLLFALVSWRAYRRRQPYFVRHLVAGLHFYSVWYLLAIVTGWIARWNENLSALGFISSVYLFFTLRRLYQLSWPRTLVGTLALFAPLMAIESLLSLIAMSFAIAGQQ
jgi:hypothetical protein